MLKALRRRKLGFWRSLGRSNRWFPRKLIVTREGKFLIFITIGLGFAAINTGNNLLYLVLGLLLSIITISGVLSESSLRGVKVTRVYPDLLTVGEPTLLRVDVQNTNTWRASFNLELHEICDSGALASRPGYMLHLAPKERSAAFIVAVAQRRGPIETEGLEIATRYPFGFARKGRFLPDASRFLALPRVRRLDALPFGIVERGDAVNARRVGLGDEFHGLRDARAGDSTHDIHWKVSARRDRLIAKEREAEATRIVVVALLNLAPPGAKDPSALDLACETAASLCSALLGRTYAVGFEALGIAVAPSRGPGAVEALRKALGALRPADMDVPAEWPLPDPEWATARADAQSTRDAVARGRPLALRPALAEPGHDRILLRFAAHAHIAIEGSFHHIVDLDDEGHPRAATEPTSEAA